MSPIFTKFMPRATLPDRIRAFTMTRGQAVYWTHDATLSVITNHQAAVAKLATKLHWPDRHYIAGPTPTGFVFVPCDVVEEHTHQ